MCGICGIANWRTSQPPAPESLEAMVWSIRHRGPDEYSVFTDGPVGLGHARLSIIDLAGGGQPMSNEDESAWIVFNGEIYNYIELTQELRECGLHSKAVKA